jgi:UDP-2,4-diacetamido-2,4,6-trideoxy-beta-L-altropyranose hydrolase
MNLMIRSDASVQIGTGHVMRCLALAQAWQAQGGQAIFVFTNQSTALESRLLLEGMQVVYLSVKSGSTEDAKQTVDFTLALNAQWLVVDGYQFGAEYQKTIKNSGLNLLFIDDYGHSEIYFADLVLNQNISARSEWYQYRSPHTQLLLGERYSLLRKEFTAWHGYQKKITDNVENILITLGGSDPDNITAWILDALQLVKSLALHLTIIVGASNPHYESLEFLASQSIHSIRLLKDVADMPQLMAEADMTIAAGGSTNWELAMLGVPTMIIPIADNQTEIAQALHDREIVMSLGRIHTISPQEFAIQFEELCHNRDRRNRMNRAGQALIDGEGCDRIVMKLSGLPLRLRLASRQDCELIWNWSNDSTTRQASFNQDFIPWAEHQQWFERRLQNGSGYFWVAIDENDHPIGQVRLDPISQENVEISISIDARYRYRGLGRHLLNLVIQKFLLKTDFKAIIAWIKVDNTASCRLFEKAQFMTTKAEYRGTQLAYQYQFLRPEFLEC